MPRPYVWYSCISFFRCKMPLLWIACIPRATVQNIKFFLMLHNMGVHYFFFLTCAFWTIPGKRINLISPGCNWMRIWKSSHAWPGLLLLIIFWPISSHSSDSKGVSFPVFVELKAPFEGGRSLKRTRGQQDKLSVSQKQTCSSLSECLHRGGGIKCSAFLRC